jgi:hypothetical protein
VGPLAALTAAFAWPDSRPPTRAPASVGAVKAALLSRPELAAAGVRPPVDAVTELSRPELTLAAPTPPVA